MFSHLFKNHNKRTGMHKLPTSNKPGCLKTISPHFPMIALLVAIFLSPNMFYGIFVLLLY